MSSLAKFRIRYGEFAAVSDALVSECLADAASELSAERWGNRYLSAACALAAHWLQLSAQAKEAAAGSEFGPTVIASGTLASTSTDRLSESYAQLNSAVAARALGLGDAVLAQTPYGQEYLRLRGRLTTSPRALRC